MDWGERILTLGVTSGRRLGDARESKHLMRCLPEPATPTRRSGTQVPVAAFADRWHPMRITLVALNPWANLLDLRYGVSDPCSFPEQDSAGHLDNRVPRLR